MFWALLHDKIDTVGSRSCTSAADTEALNARAARGDVDVIAVSIARFATLAKRLPAPPPRRVGRARLGAGRGDVAPQAALEALQGRGSASPGSTRRRTSRCASASAVRRRSSSPSAPSRSRSTRSARARSTPRCSSTKGGSPTSAKGFARSSTSGRRGTGSPEGSRCLSAETRSGAGSARRRSRGCRDPVASRSRGRSSTGDGGA